MTATGLQTPPGRSRVVGSIKEASSKGPSVGRKRTAEPDPTTPEGQWALFLRHLIEERRLSVTQFAEDAGKGQATVFRYLRGDVCPPLNEWTALARALGLSSWRDLVPPAAFVAKLPRKRPRKT